MAKDCQKVREPALEAGERIVLMEVDFEQFKKVVADKDFRDTEISLEVLRSLPDPKKVEKIRRLFFD